MEESDHEMSDEGESDTEAWAGLIPGPDERMEQCKLGGKVLKLPELFLEKKHIFKSVLSLDTWNTALSDDQRNQLESLLPKFPEEENEEIHTTLSMLFSGENFKFGNPLQDLQKKLKEGYLHPEIARYRKQTRQFRYRDYKMRQQRHLSDLLKRLLLSRQELLEHATALAPGDPIKFQYPPPPVKRISPMEQIIKKKSIRILKEVREECGVPDTSSEEDEESTSPVQRSRRQLFKSLGPIPSPEPTLPSVVATFASKPPAPPPSSTPMVNGDAHPHGSQSAEGQSHPPPSAAQAKRPRPISPVEVTEDSYKLMLRLHKRKKLLQPDLPELDTSSVTLQDILARCQANKKNLKGSTDLMPTNLATMKKRLKMKAKGERKPKLKTKEPAPIGVDDDAMLPRLPSPSLDTSAGFHASDGLPDNPLKTVYGPAVNFCCLLRDILLEFPDGKTSTAKLEERLQEWLEHNDEISNPWMALLSSWQEQVTPALKFMSGADQGTQPLENFSPMVECCSSSSREKPQHYRWVGPPGLDSDAELTQIFRLWLQAKEEANSAAIAAADVIAEISASAAGSPPPPKAKTNFIVRPTSSNEKALFREQERSRFASPHKAFTFMMHGYDSVVGPVKGVYDKDSSTNKAREHNLLVSDRPPFVTILTLVRDAAARLPNGEGTRGDICELLKDSQFLAPGVTDTQINAVVSGALDRLHSEKDPCVKYDVTRKLWIYLHRNRTEDEFERIHQAQAATAKTKKTVAKPKTAKVAKDSAVSNPPIAATIVPPTLASSPLHQPSFTLSTLPTTTPGLSQQPALVTPKLTPSESASLLTKSGKSATLLRTPSLGVGGTFPPGVTSLTPTIAQLRAAQAAMAKSSPTISSSGSGNISKLQTVKQLTSGSGQMSKKSASLAGQLTSSASPAAAATTTGSPLLTVTPLGLSTTSSSSAIFSSTSLAASSSLAAQLLYSPGITLGSGTPLTVASSSNPQQNLHQSHQVSGSKQKTGAGSSTSSSSPSSSALSTLSVPVTTATTFSLVTTLNTGAASAGGNPTPLRPPTISMLQSQQILKQQQLLLKQQQQQAASQNALRQNAALVAAVGQNVASLKSLDSARTTVVSTVTTGGKSSISSSSSTILKPHMFTMAARPSPPPNVAVTKNPTAVSSLKASSSAGLKQASLILSQEGVASLTSAAAAAGGVAPTGKLVALTSVAGQQAGEGTVMAQIMQQAAVAQHAGGLRNSAQAIRLQGGNLVQPILSGKPIQIGGKPFGTKGLVQLAGKAGQPLGLIRTPQGPLSTINLIPQTVVSSAAGGKTATVVAVGTSSSSVPSSPSPLTTTASGATTIITTSASARQQQQQQLAAFAAAHSGKSGGSAGQAKILGQTPAGLVVTQLAPGNIALRAAGSGQTKVLPSGQASLVPTQFILQHAPGAVATSQGASAPIIVSSNAAGGKGAQNLQVMRTVLSQPGNLKPGQATILISQPTLPQVAASSTQGLTAAQVLQTGGKTSGRGSPKGKGQPVYARIITPPPGMKLSSVAQVPITGGGGGVVAAAAGVGAGAAATGNINVIQTVGGKLTLVTSGMATHTLSSLPMVSLAMVNNAATPVAAGSGDAVQVSVAGGDSKGDKLGQDSG